MVEFELPGSLQDALRDITSNDRFWQELTWSCRNVQNESEFSFGMQYVLQRFVFVGQQARQVLVNEIRSEIKEAFTTKDGIAARVEELRKNLLARYPQTEINFKPGRGDGCMTWNHEYRTMFPPSKKRHRREESPPLNLLTVSPKSVDTNVTPRVFPVLKIKAPTCSPLELSLITEEYW